MTLDKNGICKGINSLPLDVVDAKPGVSCLGKDKAEGGLRIEGIGVIG